MNDKMIKAAVNASNTIASIYEWVDRCNKAGGATSISGVATCNAMLKTLTNNKNRIDELVMKPLEEELEKAKHEASQ